MEGLPLYEILPGATGQGVHEVALVASPAIEIGWLAFARANFHPNCRCEINAKGTVKLSKGACDFCVEAKRAYNAARRSGIGAPAAIEWISPDDLNFRAVSPERRMIAGPLMVPDLKIYRRDGEKEYEVFFSEETIRTFAVRFFRDGRTSRVNEEHTDTLAPAYVVESWIVDDTKTDKSAALGFSVPKGTWFAVVHVEDQSYWDEAVKTGKVRGFSVEGTMSVAQTTTNKKMKNEKFSVTLDNGTVIANSEDTDVFAVGEELWVVLESGEKVHAEDGQYELPDGSVIDAVGGRIVAVRPADEEMADEAPDAFEAFRNETAVTLADLAGRLGALEAALAESKTAMAEQKKTIDEQSEELKKFKAATPGAKSITVKASKAAPVAATKPSVRPKLSLAALENVDNYLKTR